MLGHPILLAKCLWNFRRLRYCRVSFGDDFMYETGPVKPLGVAPGVIRKEML